MKAVPGWNQPQAILMVWPEECKRGNLVDSFVSFSGCLPPEQEIVFALSSATEDKERRILKLLGGRRGVTFIALPSVQDIWICDWGPINVSGAQSLAGVKTRYAPRYLQDAPAFARGDDRAGGELCEKLQILRHDLSLVLDGGNFTHNGAGVAIVTERVLSDNRGLLDEAEIRQAFRESLGINRLLIIPEEPGDETGHVDGFVRFISERTVALAAYPEDYEGARFMDNMEAYLRDRLGPAFQIVRILNGYPPDEITEGIPSAVGNHLNFVRLGSVFVVPAYGIPEDDVAVETISSLRECRRIIRTDPAATCKLASLGGVFQCCTWPLLSGN